MTETAAQNYNTLYQHFLKVDDFLALSKRHQEPDVSFDFTFAVWVNSKMICTVTTLHDLDNILTDMNTFIFEDNKTVLCCERTDVSLNLWQQEMFG